MLAAWSGAINIIFRGVRGSYPVAGALFRRYGSESTCCEVRVGGRLLVFDAGSGIISLSKQMCDNKESELSLFFTHFHIDHCFGMNYFVPFHLKSTEVAFVGPVYGKGSLKQNLEHITDVLVHPVSIAELPCKKHYIDVKGEEVFVYREGRARPYLRKSGKTTEEEVVVRTLHNKQHSQLGVINYRVEHRGKAFVFATDVECDRESGYNKELAEFSAGADLLAMDGQYTSEEYETRVGWGHSAYDMTCRTAEVAKVKKLVIIHHDPSHDDKAMHDIATNAKGMYASTIVAREGGVITL